MWQYIFSLVYMTNLYAGLRMPPPSRPLPRLQYNYMNSIPRLWPQPLTNWWYNSTCHQKQRTYQPKQTVYYDKIPLYPTRGWKRETLDRVHEQFPNAKGNWDWMDTMCCRFQSTLIQWRVQFVRSASVPLNTSMSNKKFTSYVLYL